MGKNKTITILIVTSLILFCFLYLKNKNNFIFDKDNWKWNDDWNGKGPVEKHDDNSIVENKKLDDAGIVATSYSEALLKSSQSGKPILVFYTAEWCQYCRKMKNETLPTSEVSQALKRYILVYVNTDIDRSGVDKFGVKNLPSFVIINHKEEKTKSSSGFMDKESFSKWLNN